MDLTVSPRYIMDISPGKRLDPYDVEASTTLLSPIRLLPLSLPPLSRVLLASVEVVRIPERMVVLIGLRSTWARFGLVSSLTVADPGFNGTLTLEVFNSSVHPILISSGDKIWSMTLVYAPDEPLYTGRYQGQHDVTRPIVFERPK